MGGRDFELRKTVPTSKKDSKVVTGAQRGRASHCHLLPLPSADLFEFLSEGLTSPAYLWLAGAADAASVIEKG